jgi:hypothetical protein
MDNDVVTLFGRKSFVEIMSGGSQTRIALKQLLCIFFPSFNTRDFRTEHRKEMANISMASAQFQKRLSVKKLVSVMINNGLNALCAPFLIPTLEGGKFARKLVEIMASKIPNSCAHFRSIRTHQAISRK